MGALSTSIINAILPRLIMEGRNKLPYQALFYQRMEAAVKKNGMINPGGLYQPFTVAENSTSFGMAEGGAIKRGASPRYDIGPVNIRNHWASMNWNKFVERIKDQYVTKLSRDPEFAGKSVPEFTKLAKGFYVQDQALSTLKMHARRNNYWALQGQSNSAIGTVSDVSNAPTFYFDPNSASSGYIANRMFGIDQQIEFRSPSGVIRNGVAAFATVDQIVDYKDANGAVHFDTNLTDVVAGDTAHFVAGYSTYPEGVSFYLGDAAGPVTTFKTINRASQPLVFSSVMLRRTGSPTIAPIDVRELLSFLTSKIGYGIPVELEFWMNKTQLFNWETYVYGALIRQVGGDEVKKVDLSIGEVYWQGRRFNIDPDMPPAAVYGLNMMAWQIIEQTPLQAYQFDSGSYVVNPINSDGDRLDAGQSTIYQESNLDCLDPAGQGILDGLAFDYLHV